MTNAIETAFSQSEKSSFPRYGRPAARLAALLAALGVSHTPAMAATGTAAGLATAVLSFITANPYLFGVPLAMIVLYEISVKLGMRDRSFRGSTNSKLYDPVQFASAEAIGKDSAAQLKRVYIEHGGKRLDLFVLPHGAGYAAIHPHAKTPIISRSAEALASVVWPEKYNGALAEYHIHTLPSMKRETDAMTVRAIEEELLDYADIARSIHPFYVLAKQKDGAWISRMLSATIAGEKVLERFAKDPFEVGNIAIKPSAMLSRTDIKVTDASSRIAAELGVTRLFSELLATERHAFSSRSIRRSFSPKRHRHALQGRSIGEKLQYRAGKLFSREIIPFLFDIGPRLINPRSLGTYLLRMFAREIMAQPIREGVRTPWSSWGGLISHFSIQRPLKDKSQAYILEAHTLRNRSALDTVFEPLSGATDPYARVAAPATAYDPVAAYLERFTKTAHGCLIDSTGQNEDAGEGLLRIYDPKTGLVCVRRCGEADGTAYVYKERQSSVDTGLLGHDHPIHQIMKELGTEKNSALRIRNGTRESCALSEGKMQDTPTFFGNIPAHPGQQDPSPSAAAPA